MDTRKNQARLPAAEKTAFVNAVLELKNHVPSQLGLINGHRYDDYVQVHWDSMKIPPGWAHKGPAFCPWHRAFLRSFELDLQAIDASVTLPYWDWTVDISPDPTAPGSPWTDNFMGGDGDPAQHNKVISGPFAFDSGRWKLNVTDGTTAFLVRKLGRELSPPTLPTPANERDCLAEVPYDSSGWGEDAQPSFRASLEGGSGGGSMHNRVHLWVAGTMVSMASPNDPVFFLHHANIDRLWAKWQQTHPQEASVPDATAADAPMGHKLKDPMNPWGSTVTVESVLNHHARGYQYDSDQTEPALLGVMLAFDRTQLLNWHHDPRAYRGRHLMHMGPMFRLSAEDVAAGGHDRGRP